MPKYLIIYKSKNLLTETENLFPVLFKEYSERFTFEDERKGYFTEPIISASVFTYNEENQKYEKLWDEEWYR